ncbi:PREDICTED: uncharacterized protein LOC109465231 [Branchiostoma belcheri]|uniref:Uncharacterized protein LOC109465231 n=1 Tax=Branchiostoma belcheri TaxID=7741 RepID=A0A6P4Y0I6_BRABE|nr:PREDICTED: uncharacterized protein LOC109465231 [Branchiostoma belcheri]
MTKAENSAMYAGSGENEEDAIENMDEEFESKVMQEDSAVVDNMDMEPYTVANMSDHENDLINATTVTACYEPQGPGNKEFPNPIYEENVCQQASDDTSHDANVHVHEVRNPTNAEEHQKPVNRPDPQQASDDTRPDSDVHKVHNPPNVKELHGCFAVMNKSCLLVALVFVLILTGGMTYGIITGVDYNTQVMQKASPIQEINTLSTLNATKVASTTKYTYTTAIIHTSDGTNPKILGTISGTNAPILGYIDGTNPSILRTIDGTKPPILGTINGDNPPNLGTTDGTTPPTLGTIDGTNPPSLGTTDGPNPPTPWVIGSTDPPNYKKKTACEKKTMHLTCAVDELIVIDDAFYGRREKDPPCGCSWIRKCGTNCKQKKNK